MHLFMSIPNCASSAATVGYFTFPTQGRLRGVDVVMDQAAAGASVSSAVVVAENKSSATVATVTLSSASTSAGTEYAASLNSSSSYGNTFFNPQSASSYATGVKVTVGAALIGTSGTDVTVHFDYDEFGRKHL